MLLSVENNLDQLPQTLHSYLTSAVVTGGTSLPVRNINSFTQNYAVQVGRTGEEQSEIVVIDTASGTILPIAASGTLVYDHNLDSPVYQIHYDQIIFKRSTSGTAGTATGLATVNITPDSMYTEYDDTSGAATYAYKTQYYNSVSGDLSTESDWFTPSGPTYYSLQKMRDRVKSALYSANYLKSDQQVDDWINEWLEEMTNEAIKVNQSYSVGTAAYAIGTAGLGTVTDSTFKQPIKMEVTWDGTNYIKSEEIPFSQWSEYDVFSKTFPRHSWIGDVIFQVLPYGEAGTVKVTFAKRNTPLVDETDELPWTLRSYTTSCIEYCLYRAFGNDQKDTVAEAHYNKYLLGRKGFISQITPRDQSGVKFIDMVEELSGRTDDASMDFF